MIQGEYYLKCFPELPFKIHFSVGSPFFLHPEGPKRSSLTCILPTRKRDPERFQQVAQGPWLVGCKDWAPMMLLLGKGPTTPSRIRSKLHPWTCQPFPSTHSPVSPSSLASMWGTC